MNHIMDINNISDITLQNFNKLNIHHIWSSFNCSGPPHMPTFNISLILQDVKYEGYGPSKKKAKINAIQNFQLNLNQMSNDVSESSATRGLKRNLDDNAKAEFPQPLKKPLVDIVSQTSAKSILHEICHGQDFVYKYESSHGLLLSMSVMVFGNKYIGYGKNKKEATEIACHNALKNIYEMYPIDDKFKKQIESLPLNIDCKDTQIIDHFAYLTDTVYKQLKFDNIKNKKYTVISSIFKVKNQLYVHFN